MPSITDVYYDNYLENEEERKIELAVLSEVSEDTIYNILFSEEK
ncbi:MAG: hypothetical protein U0K68_06715 [Agathobacter sp.]|nr:hypothetical protein [Agathobacter sp.]